MVSFFCFGTIYENNNLVSISYSRKSMSNYNYGDLCAFSVVINGFLNNPFVHFIKCRGSFIKK